MTFVMLCMPIFGQTTKPTNTSEVRGQVATGSYEWNALNFAGFYYDIDNDLGTERISTTVTAGTRIIEPNGVTYTTTIQENYFDFADWGFYNIIGFQGNKYFAGYIWGEDTNNSILFSESVDENSLADEQLEAILIDDDTEFVLTSDSSHRLKEDYELAIKSIDASTGMLYVELIKKGQIVDSKILSPSKTQSMMADQTYYYRKDVGNSKNLVTIAVHFKNAFHTSKQDMATIDGIWQISEAPIDLKVDTVYDKMTVTSVSIDTITMKNKDNAIILSMNKDISLMAGFNLRTAYAHELRYYIYSKKNCDCT